jgi:hypothetical protein
MSEVLGRVITASKSDVPKNKDAARSGNEDLQNSAIRKMFRWYDSHGLLGNSLTLQAVLGREPRTLRAFFEDLVSRKVSSVDLSTLALPLRAPQIDGGAQL